MANHHQPQQAQHHPRPRPHAPIHNHQQQIESQSPAQQQTSQPLHNQQQHHMGHNPQHIHHPQTFPNQPVPYMYATGPHHYPPYGVYPPAYGIDSTYLPHQYPQAINTMPIPSPNVPPQTKTSHNLNAHSNERQQSLQSTSQLNAVPSQPRKRGTSKAILKDPNTEKVIEWNTIAMNPSQSSQNNSQNDVNSVDKKSNTSVTTKGVSKNDVARELLLKVSATEDNNKTNATIEGVSQPTPSNSNLTNIKQTGVANNTDAKTTNRDSAPTTAAVPATIAPASALNVSSNDEQACSKDVKIDSKNKLEGDQKLGPATTTITDKENKHQKQAYLNLVEDKKVDLVSKESAHDKENVSLSETSTLSKDKIETAINTKAAQNDEPVCKLQEEENKGDKKMEVTPVINETDGIEKNAKSEQSNIQQDGEEIAEEKDDQDSTNLTYDNNEQYNPVTNRTGKRKYSKKFLLEVCEKVCKFKLFADSSEKFARDANRSGGLLSEKIDHFAVPFSNSTRYTPVNRQNDVRRQNQNAFGGRNSAGPDKPRRVIAAAPLTPEVELKTAEKPWRPAKEVEESMPQDELELEVLKKKFRGILNKLTPQNFDSLAKVVQELNINTESKLEEVIDIVFAKALAEPGFCVLYGQMCSLLKRITAGTANFNNNLLKRCQAQFQADIYAGINMETRQEAINKEEDAEVKKQLEEAMYEDMWKCRKRGLGLVKFIGELYKIEMLNKEIMFECIGRLQIDKSEESLECLCDLLATIGEKLEEACEKEDKADKDKKTAKSSSRPKPHSGQIAYAAAAAAATHAQPQKNAEQQPQATLGLDGVFDALHKIRKSKDLNLSSRIKFKLLDTCDLREKYHWQSRRAKDNNLQKIDDIHKEAQEKKLEQEKRLAKTRQDGGGRRGFGHSGSSNQISSMAIEPRTNSLHTSASSHVLRDQSLNENPKANQNDLEKEHANNKEKVIGINSLFRPTIEGNSTNGGSLRPSSALFKTYMPTTNPTGSSNN